MAVPVTRRSFSVDEFHRMAAAGIFSEDDRVELLDGEVVLMTPIGSRHAACVNRLNHWFVRAVGGRAIVAVQNPVRLGDHSEPQPDVVLLKPRADFYATAHPGPEDVLLVVEVSESSSAVDREVKAPLYGRHGVAELWLVDLAAGHLEVCRAPTPAGYQETRVYRRGEAVAPQALPDLAMAVAEILG